MKAMPCLWVAAAALLGACQLPTDNSTAPTAPTNLRIIAGSPPTLAWDAVEGAESYNIYRSCEWDAWPSLNDKAVEETQFPIEDDGYYTVTAVNAGGESSKAGPPVLDGAPSAPRYVRIDKVGAQHFLKWDAVLGATSYAVYRAVTCVPSPFPPAPAIATVVVTQYLIPGPGFCYWVAALSGGEESEIGIEDVAHF